MGRFGFIVTMKLYINEPIWLDYSIDGVFLRRGTDGLFLHVPTRKDVMWLNDGDLTWTTERVSLADPVLENDFNCMQIPNMDLPMNTTALTVLPPQPTEQQQLQPHPFGAPPSLTDMKPVIPRKCTAIVNSREKNGFMLYCQENKERVKTEIGTLVPGGVVAELDRRWKLLTEDEKKRWKNS